MRNNNMMRVIPCLMMALLLAGGCASSPSQRTFKSPDEAVNSFVAAIRAGDQKQLDQIFGKDGKAIISSGDKVADRNDAERFLAAYDARHTLVPDADGGMTLTVGRDDWPFPIPLVQRDEGWAFDTAAGKDEILNRRIGRNELETIQVIQAIVDAQREFARLDPQRVGLPVYARRIMSEPGKKNGLYWPVEKDGLQSPLGPLVAEAAEEGYTRSRKSREETPPYHGYRYRLLTAQGPHAQGGASDYLIGGNLLGGFGVLAFPAEYGNSGITTFIVNHKGTIYQQDLGKDTPTVARAITTFDPGEGWTEVHPDQARPAQ